MKLSKLGTFTIGVIVSTVSVGAMSFANAAGDAKLKACADKSTGVMRYISKGSCKKTETSLSWNQLGAQGLQGVAGTNGSNGTNGAKGDAGTNGTNGQNYYAVDATGKTLGRLTNSSFGTFDVVIDGLFWNLGRDSVNYGSSAQGNASVYYANSSCTIPFVVLDSAVTPRTWTSTNNLTGVLVSYDGHTGDYIGVDAEFKAYQPAGAQLSWSTTTVYTWNQTWREPDLIESDWNCEAMADDRKVFEANRYALFASAEVSRPTYVAPLSLVSR